MEKLPQATAVVTTCTNLNVSTDASVSTPGPHQSQRSSFLRIHDLMVTYRKPLLAQAAAFFGWTVHIRVGWDFGTGRS
jgi:hypothetical protein